ncbi:MAG: hypothetical protein ACFCU3_00530 [Verrucomicrobiales bacterium]
MTGQTSKIILLCIFCWVAGGVVSFFALRHTTSEKADERVRAGLIAVASNQAAATIALHQILEGEEQGNADALMFRLLSGHAQVLSAHREFLTPELMELEAKARVLSEELKKRIPLTDPADSTVEDRQPENF